MTATKAVAVSPNPLLGTFAPDFTMPTNGGGKVTLSALQGQNVVLYFYPKDDTPGCTIEAKDFRDLMDDFKKANTTIIGVSKDDVRSHDKFAEKFCLPFILASDTDGSVCDAYGTWIEKSMYGKKYMGIDRVTFLIDAKGKIAQVWNKVKVDGHASEVLGVAKRVK